MAAAGDFIVRMRVPTGMKRFAFKSDAERFGQLQTMVQNEFGIAPDAQLISIKPLADPEFLIGVEGQTFRQLGIKHGDMLNIILDGAAPPAAASAAAGAAAAAPAIVKLTNKCQHGPKDRCIHCLGGELGKTQKFKCNHSAASRCINCSDFKSSGKGACNHPPTAFCANCAPEHKADVDKPNAEAEAKKRMFCHCKNGQKCIHCAQQVAAMKVDVLPFNRLLADRRAMCHFKHSADTSCPSCLPDEMPNFRGNPKCTNGHLPWPGGCCSKCMPPNAVLKLQPYRHVDYVTVQEKACATLFVSQWHRNPVVQRAALIFGNYVDEPAESGNPGAVRAQIQAFYYPPQENKADRVNFARDPKEESVFKVASALGIHPIGWAVTALPRLPQEQYGGAMVLSGAEVRQAARFQARFTDAHSGRSPFFTLVFQMNAEQQVEPFAFQVSDMCAALERDGVLTDCADIGFLAVREAKKGEFLPGIMYKDKLMNANEPFLPDDFIVKAVVSEPKVVTPMFRHAKFPFVGNSAAVAAHLTALSREEWHQKLSDFNLLVHLPAVIGLPRTLAVCEAVKAKRALTAPERVELEKALRAASVQF